jgi:hypothetical protein|tara:strand:+ start:569 stop:1096 length:528 start_codon:yes stop_codon:yes gene_type:complete
MKKLLIFIGILFIAIGSADAQSKRNKKKADTETATWNYTIECVGEAAAGVYTLKVFSILPDERLAGVQASKNAVHAIIFQGINAQGRKCKQKPALARSINLETEREDFFKEFFASVKRNDPNNFAKYVNVVEEVTDRQKLGKKKYRIGTLVTVNVALLRKKLEEENIIKSLSSGF